VRGTGSLRRFPGRRRSPANKTNSEARNKLQKIRVKRAVWEFRFYWWRNIVLLTVGTAVGIDTLLAVVTGHEPTLIGAIGDLIKDACTG
jgi:hypothetical protein